MMLRNIIKKTIRPVVRKPWHSDDMEVHYGIWIGVSALFNKSGRQLGEENSRPFILNHHIPATTIQCKYEGSRKGHAINMSALRIAMPNFDYVMDVTSAICNYHMIQINKEGQKPNIWDLYLISRASVAIIAYQIRSTSYQNSTDDVVSDGLASQYQFISGIFMICREMLNNADPIIRDNIAISSEDLYHYADENGIFLSDNGMACAGSTTKIMEFLELCNGSRNRADVIDVTDIAAENMLEALTGNVHKWYEYAILTLELDCYFETEAQRRRAEKMTKNREILLSSAQYYEKIALYCRKILYKNRPQQDINSNDIVTFEQGALKRQNQILKTLGRKPLSALQQAHVDIRLGIGR